MNSLTVVEARAADGEAVATLVNRAYAPAEAFLYDGPRTSPDEIRARLRKGTFLVHVDSDGAPLGCVYVEATGDQGYLGMLAVSPARQGRGLGRDLVAAAESFLRARGVRRIEIEVVNLRRELFSFYEHQGYRVVGQRPFDEPRLRQPCHFVVMHKTLA